MRKSNKNKEIQELRENFLQELKTCARKLYDEFNKTSNKPYEEFSEILTQARQKFRNHNYLKIIKDPEQAWKTILGHILEDLIEYSLQIELDKIGLKCAKPTIEELGEAQYSLLKQQIGIKIGEEIIFPDADRIIYIPEPFTVIAILSIKKKFRERIAQVAYWATKLRTQNIKAKILMITTNENKTFTEDAEKKGITKKALIIAKDIDWVLIASKAKIKETGNIKNFDKIIEILRKLKEEY